MQWSSAPWRPTLTGTRQPWGTHCYNDLRDTIKGKTLTSAGLPERWLSGAPSVWLTTSIWQYLPGSPVSLFRVEHPNLSLVPDENQDLEWPGMFGKSPCPIPSSAQTLWLISLLPFIPTPQPPLQLIPAKRENGHGEIIRLSSSPVKFFFVGKKEVVLQPCIDYRALNNITVKNKYHLPLINTLFEPLQEATVFSKLDLRNAYLLVWIREGDECKTKFNTPLGHFDTCWYDSG